MLRGDTLALAAELHSQGIGDLEVTRNAGTIVHPTTSRDQNVKTFTTSGAGRQISARRPPAGDASWGAAGADETRFPAPDDGQPTVRWSPAAAGLRAADLV